jgi:hypothetical protein
MVRFMFFSLEAVGSKLPTGLKNIAAQTRIGTPEAISRLVWPSKPNTCGRKVYP